MGFSAPCQRQKHAEFVYSSASATIKKLNLLINSPDQNIGSAMSTRKRVHNRRKTGVNNVHAPKSDRSPARAAMSWIYGVHAVNMALSNPDRELHRLVVTKEAFKTIDNADAGFTVEILDRREITSLLPPGATHQGIALLTDPLPTVSINDLISTAADRDRMSILALDQITDPQNVGAILRSAAAFGADAVLVPDRHTPETSGAMAKAASGAIEAVHMVRPTNLVRALRTLKLSGFWVVGLDVNASSPIGTMDLPDKCILAFGAEGRGLRRLTHDACDLLVSIPTTDAIQSLNVSASAAIALYEWNRQR